MKKLVAFLVLVPALVWAVEQIDYAPSEVFVPVGFDDNDNTQVVLDGIFPNTCYKVSEPSVEIDKAGKKIQIVDKAFYHKGSVCLYMLVPYFKTVNLGVLPEAQYDVEIRDASGRFIKAAAINVAKATTSDPDNYLYAPVEEVVVNQSGAVPQLVLRGNFTQSCLRVKEVKVSIYRNPNNVVVVQPIAEEDGSVCKEVIKPFVERVELAEAPAGKALIHVRSLNGQALNRMINF